MKIAVLSFTSGVVNRGVETAVYELCQRWAKNNHVRAYQMGRQSVLKKNLNDIYHLSQEDNRVGYSVEHIVNEKMWWWEVFGDLNKWKPDVVLPMNRGWQAVLTRLFCWQTGAKMIISGQAGLKDRWSLLVRPDVFVVLTKQAARWASRFAFGVKVVVIPNGVDLKRFTPSGGKLKFNLERPIILCVAGGERYKRVEETIKAVALLKQGGLLLAGGSQKQEKFGKKILGNRFLRRIFVYEQMPLVYRTADVFTLASESTEAFGIAYLEALACGLPAVAPDDELRREILGEYGIYVRNVTDAPAYAHALKTALKKEKCYPWQQLNRYNWDNIAEKYYQLFTALHNRV